MYDEMKERGALVDEWHAALARIAELEAALRHARALLTAAAISSSGDLIINDGALARANLYETIHERDEPNARLRVRVRPDTSDKP